MKTILYNPIFINPQAYFVFPQLYDIEKGDSFIEPAAYAGQLMIENLTDNTKVMLENNVMQIDFTQFAGKHIRINQYTNIGAVVLGEWNIPEGKPSGPSFHESLVDAWVMSGLSNSTKPTEIVGVKGNSLQLKNFAYALNSGFGKYTVNWNSFAKTTVNANFTNSDSVIHLTEILVAGGKFLQTKADGTVEACQIKVEGITDDIKLRYVSYAEDGTGTYTYLKNGINDLPISYKKYTGFAASVVGSCNITITQLPTAYEGALVFDGVDDYGICNNLPILTDYTVICRRVIEEKDNYTVASKGYTLNNVFYSGAFIVERQANPNNKGAFSFGVNTQISSFSDNEIIYQTKNQYMSTPIKYGDVVDSDKLALGTLGTNVNTLYSCLKGAIYYFALYDKSLTPEEIEEEKVKLESEWAKYNLKFD